MSQTSREQLTIGLDLFEVTQQKGARLFGAQPERHVGQNAKVHPIPYLRPETHQRPRPLGGIEGGGHRPQLIPQCHPQHMPQLWVAIIDAADRSEKGTQLNRVRMRRQGIGRGALHQRTRIVEAGDREISQGLRPLAALGKKSHRVDTDERVRIAGGLDQVRVVQTPQAVQDPKGVDSGYRAVCPGQEFFERLDRRLADTVGEHVGGSHSERQIWVFQRGDELGRRRPGQVPGVCGPRCLVVHDSPDAPAMTIASRVVQRHFVVTDDPIVEVRNVERSVGTELKIHRSEPWVVRGDKIVLLFRLHRRTSID